MITPRHSSQLKEYKELLEKQLKLTQHDSPIYMSQAQQDAWVEGVRSTALYALEMLLEVLNAKD